MISIFCNCVYISTYIVEDYQIFFVIDRILPPIRIVKNIPTCLLSTYQPGSFPQLAADMTAPITKVIIES